MRVAASVLLACSLCLAEVLEDPPLDEILLEQQKETGRAALLSRATETTSEAELSAVFRSLARRLGEETGCLAVLGDRAHQPLFGRAFFKQLGPVPVFKVLVQDKEDLLSPNYGTLRALRQVRKEGCGAYLLLLANGIQMARLLRFGDAQRVLDTRGRFVIAYDKRLLAPALHYLWKKIVNVVFVRRFGGPWAVGSLAGRRSVWFELSTVPFPAPIRDVLVTRRLDIWRKGAFRQNADLFRDKTSDLQNQTLAVVTFQHVPAAFRLDSRAGSRHGAEGDEGGTAGYSGLEVQVMQALARAMNFAPHLYAAADADVEQWGTRQLNGSMSGLLGEVISGRAELVLGDLHYTPYHLQLMDLSVPYHSECLTFLTPESTTDNSWQTLILPFKPEMWLAVGLALAGGSVFFFALARSGVAQHRDEARQRLESKQGRRLRATFRQAAARLGRGLGDNVRRLSSHLPQLPHLPRVPLPPQLAAMARKLRRRRDAEPEEEGDGGDWPPGKTALHLFAESLGSSSLYASGMLLGVSLPSIPTAWAVRVMTGWWWLYSILVVVAYRAALTAILANPAPKITIDSLEQLADSALALGGWGEHQKDFFLTSLDEAGQKVGRKFEVTADWEGSVERVAQGSFAYYENAHFLQFAAARRRARVKEQQRMNAEATANATTTANGVAGNASARSPPGAEVVASSGPEAESGAYSAANSTNSNSTNTTDQAGPWLEARRMHIMRDCVISMPISLGLQRNSPLKPRVDRFLRRVIEAGLVHKWLADAMLATTGTGLAGVAGSDPEESVKALMELRKLYGALVALAAGYLLSALALVAEVAFHRGVEVRRQGYDVYAVGRGLGGARWNKRAHRAHRSTPQAAA